MTSIKNPFHKAILTALFISFSYQISVQAKVEIDPTDTTFAKMVSDELESMRQGKRGVVCTELVKRLDNSEATTTIKPITSDEKTWHPNDRKGTRSHVVALDTKPRGGARATPVSTILYLHPSRIDPHLSLYRLGTFVDELANSVDMNTGNFSGDYRIQERRAAFFRNGWKDSMGSSLVAVSGRVSTLDYQEAKKKGLITAENAPSFPILLPDQEVLTPSANP